MTRTAWGASSRVGRLLALAIVVALAGCGGLFGPGDGMGACDPCRESADCEPGLTCQQFRDADNGNPRNLCGDANPEMTCPTN